jgi:hypothetical protein
MVLLQMRRKTSLFCILRDLPQQKKIPMELCGGGGRSHNISTFPCSNGKDFFDGMDQETMVL